MTILDDFNKATNTPPHTVTTINLSVEVAGDGSRGQELARRLLEALGPDDENVTAELSVNYDTTIRVDTLPF